MPPIEAYKKGVLGDEKSPGCGLPSKIVDEEKFRLDFMPFYRRTVQDYGIEIDKIYYYHDVLRRWTHAVDPNDRKRKRKFTCRYDPRDISVIWFYDPEVNTYYQIPYRDTSHPAISIWELREAKNKIGADKVDRLSERDIFEAYERMRDIEFVAVEKSKVARRANQRRKHHNNIERPLLDTGTVSNEQKIITDPMPGSPSGIEPYDEMVDLS